MLGHLSLVKRRECPGAHEYLQEKNPRLGFVHTQKGEVDFIVPEQFAIEIKWSPSPQNLSKAYKELLIPKKEVWHTGFFFGNKVSDNF